MNATLTPSTAAERSDPAGRLTRFLTGPWPAFTVFVAALAVRLIGIGSAWLTVEDTAMTALASRNYMLHGFLGPDNWWTQPFKYVAFEAWALVFGDGFMSVRVRGAILGALLVLLVFLIARRLFGPGTACVWAAALTAVDPLCVAFSLSIAEDTLAAVFVLAGVLLWLSAADGENALAGWLFAIVAGLAISTRLYTLIPLLVMAVAALWVRWRKHGVVSAIVTVVTQWILVPAAIFFVTFLPWTLRGYGIGDIIALTVDGLTVQNAKFPTYSAGLMRLANPGRWLYSWSAGAATNPFAHFITPAGWQAWSITMNDPVLWILFIPAVGYAIWQAWRQRNGGLAVIAGSSCASYGLLLSLSRPVLLYGALMFVPFGFVMVGYLAERLPAKIRWIVLVACVGWCLYLLPIVIGIPVPAAAYGWVPSVVGQVGGGS